MIRLGTYRSRTEAELVRGRLEVNGIDAIIQADEAAGLYPQFEAARGVQVLVRDSDLAEAMEILERMLPSGDDQDSESPQTSV